MIGEGKGGMVEAKEKVTMAFLVGQHIESPPQPRSLSTQHFLSLSLFAGKVKPFPCYVRVRSGSTAESPLALLLAII